MYSEYIKFIDENKIQNFIILICKSILFISIPNIKIKLITVNFQLSTINV